MNTSAPKKPCRHPACNKLGTTAYCLDHTRQKKLVVKQKQKSYDDQRGSRHERGYDSRWSKYSKHYRATHPLCVMCEIKGIVTLVQCVDHIEPVYGPDDPLFWNPNNHQGLCFTCHGEKTASEDGGWSNPVKRDR